VGVGEARDGGRYPVAVDLNSKTCAGTSFPRGRAAAVQRGATGASRAKISDQPYRFLNINPAFTIYVK